MQIVAYCLSLAASGLVAVERRIGGLAPAARWSLALAWFALVSLLSHVPGTDVDSTQGYLELLALGHLNILFRMAAHASVFGAFATLVYLALRGNLVAQARFWALAAAATLVAGLVDELHQHYVPLRHGRWQDALVDVVGGSLLLAAVLKTAGAARSRRASLRPAAHQTGEAAGPKSED